MSELSAERPKGDYSDLVKWHLKRMPNAVDEATDKVNEMVQNLALANKLIEKTMVRKGAEDLVVTKTFTSFCFQETILKKISHRKGELTEELNLKRNREVLMSILEVFQYLLSL